MTVSTPPPAPGPRYWPWMPVGFSAFALAWSGLWLVASGAELTAGWALQFVVPELVFWNVWGAVAPRAMRLARRLPIPRAARHWAMHLGLAVGVTLAVYALSLGLQSAYHVAAEALGASFGETVGEMVRRRAVDVVGFGLPLGCLIYGMLAAAALAGDYVARLRAEERRSAALQTELARAELDALKMQLHPHFLFNALNTISATLQTDPAAADRMVTQLGDFLRLTLDHAHRSAVPLADELAFCRRYLQIEQHRLEDRLAVSVEVAPEAAGAEVPHLLLQPLVENAVRHGVGRSVEAGRVGIRAWRDGDALVLDVTNTGPPLAAAASLMAAVGGDGAPAREGIGLANTRGRLARAYGAAASLQLDDVEGGVRARVRLPYARAADAPAPERARVRV